MIKTTKFKTLEDLIEKRKSVFEKFSGELPDYLIDYFDEEEKRLVKDKLFTDIREAKYSHTYDERRTYKQSQTNEFWDNNKTRIIKVKKGIREDAKVIYDDSSPLIQYNEAEEEKDLTTEEVRVLKQLCEKDIYLFAIRYLPHYLRLPNSPLHRYLYGYINRLFSKKRYKGTKKAIAAPRGAAKSTIISNILPLWCLLYKKKHFVIIVSDTAGQAEDFLTDIKRELEFNKLLMKDFPEACGIGPRWRTTEIISRNEVKILALGTGNKIRGRKFGVRRPDLLIGDELEDPEMVRSESKRDFIRFQWFNKDFLFVGGEKGTITDFLVAGTILGKDALLTALIDPNEYPDWDSIKFKAVEKFSISDLWTKWAESYKNVFDIHRKATAQKFFDNNKKEMLKDTKVLWPEGDPYYDLMIHKLSDPSGFNSEKQNDPLDPTKILITKENLNWKNFQTDANILKILLTRNNYWYGSLYPSLGKKASYGDYSCIVTICKDLKSGLVLVTDISLERRPVEKQIDSILQYHIDFRYKLFAIETNLFQLVVAENLRTKSRENGIYIPIKELENHQDKKARVESIIPLLYDGTIIFDLFKYKTNQQYRIGVDQLATFTGENDRHDDFPDALEMAVRLAKTTKYKLSVKNNKR